jgi:hypothetical protein
MPQRGMKSSHGMLYFAKRRQLIKNFSIKTIGNGIIASRSKLGKSGDVGKWSASQQVRDILGEKKSLYADRIESCVLSRDGLHETI